jgi:hypothetical protein
VSLNENTWENRRRHTEELLGRVAGVNNLYDTRTERLDARNVVGKDAHVTGGSGKVDLDYIGRREDRLQRTQRI